jgi:hypothetical protein
MKRSEIEKKFFDELVHDVDSGKITGTSERVAIISSGALVMAIDRLDKSSSRLWKASLGLTVVMLIVGLLQVCLTLRGH